MNSAIYTGWVRHHRFLPKEHRFKYKMSMYLLDLAELDLVFRKKFFWSVDRPNLVSFQRKDHYGEPQVPLDQSVRDLVEQRIGVRPEGSIRLLTNLRYFGFAMNPVSFYYCFDQQESLAAIVAEVNNTPWGEQHCYVFSAKKRIRSVHRFEFEKDFHVSPFMSMDQSYDWRIGEPGNRLVVHMKNFEKEKKMFQATLSLKREPMTARNLNWNLFRFPFITGKVFAGIYWNALRLYLKKVPFYPHPDKQVQAQQQPPVQLPARHRTERNQAESPCTKPALMIPQAKANAKR